MGEQGIRITYDRVFKHLFNPRAHPERLEQLLGAILGESVEILEVLDNAGTQIQESSSFVIMDAVVRLTSGAIVHVDMQKIGYAFPVERTACYSADLMMRQYIDIKAKKKSAFTFEDISKVYSIVIMENSSKIFKENEFYKHHGKIYYDSGISLDYPCENVFISLDKFLEITHTEITNKSDAWFAFLANTKVSDILRLCDAFPEFTELYQEMFEFCKDVKGMIGMFSEVLWEMSRNEERLVMQQWKEEMEEEKARLRDIVEAEVRADIKAEMEAEVRADIKAEMEAEVRADIKAEMEAEIRAKEQARAELELAKKRIAELEKLNVSLS